jgi:outer membrane immunogenic protein
MCRSFVVSATAASLLLGVSLSAEAADLPAPPPPMPQAPAFIAPPPFSWTGFYLGGNVGAGWNHGNLSDSLGLYNWGANNSTTFVGGGQVGVNYQINMLVLGIEGDFDWFANNNNSGGGTAIATGLVPGSFVQGSNNGRWLTTLTGRAGLAADRLLVYMKAGGAWVGSNNVTLTNLPTGASVSIGNGNTNTGWVAGAGLEWAFANNWTAKFEYDYVGLSDKSITVTIPTVGADTFSTNSRNVQMVTVGINYLFNFTNY